MLGVPVVVVPVVREMGEVEEAREHVDLEVESGAAAEEQWEEQGTTLLVWVSQEVFRASEVSLKEIC